jgi:hypothetical protein
MAFLTTWALTNEVIETTCHDKDGEEADLLTCNFDAPATTLIPLFAGLQLFLLLLTAILLDIHFRRAGHAFGTFGYLATAESFADKWSSRVVLYVFLFSALGMCVFGFVELVPTGGRLLITRLSSFGLGVRT